MGMLCVGGSIGCKRRAIKIRTTVDVSVFSVAAFDNNNVTI
jgi:hypothetical protein